MANETTAVSRLQQGRRALFLTSLMLLSSVIPILSAPIVSAHDSGSSTIWAKEGSVDTGWVQLNATGANAINGTPAMTNWTMDFAPGAVLENLSFEIRVDGSSGVSIQEPLIISPNTGQVMFDWRGNGWLGQTNGFDGNNPHQGRLSPNADVGATFTLPSGTEITDLILEALAPADPYTSLTPIELYIRDSAIHPTDGRLYLALGDFIIILDAMSDPKIIDLFQIKDSDGGNWVTDLEIDIANNRMLMTTEYGDLLSVNLTDSSWNPNLPPEPSGNSFNQIHVASSGALFAYSESGIFTLNSAGTGWTLELASGTTNWPIGTPWKTLEHNGIIYSSLLGGGVGRWDTSTMTALSSWSTANNLHSDYISDFLISGNQLLISSYNAGVARRDLSGSFWLATWNDGNWLSSNEVVGMTLVGNQIDMLTTTTVHSYNTNSGSFSTSTNLASIGQYGEGTNIIHWPAGGARAPSQDWVLVSDGMAIFAILEPGNTPFHSGDLVIGSGPQNGDMNDALQFNGVVYVGSGTYLDRYSLSQARWLSAIPMGGHDVSRIVTDGTNIIVGTFGSGIIVVDTNGNIIRNYDTTNGLASNEISDLDAKGNWIAAIHPQDGAVTINQTSSSMIQLNEQNGLDSDSPTGIAIHSGIAYIGTTEDGLNRYILENDTFLGSWVSTGINDVDFAPVAILGTGTNAVLHLGLPGYGVVRKDLSTGEILIPLTQVSDRSSGPEEVLPSLQVYALEENNGDLFVGTSSGAIIWDGNSATSLSSGTSWQTNPQQFFDFAVDGADLYAGTNLGVCKYDASSGQIVDCQNAQDGMPNWGVNAVGFNSTTIFGGTTSGVGLIGKSNFTVYETWEAGESTGNAPVEVIGNIAYIGLDNIGVARYDIQNNVWLPTWTGSGVLDTEGITGLVADIRANHLWVGGDDGFQLINVTSSTEVYDIEKSNSLYSGSGDPYDMIVHGNTLYYHQQFSSDSVYRIDIMNFSSLTPLDAGAELDENGGDVYGLEIIGDILHVSVASGQWWNTEGSGGIALYNISSQSWISELLPDGSVDRVTSFVSSTGNVWISWGELKLQAYSPTGTKIGEWDDLEFPVREMVEYDGEILFATEDGIARYNESSSQWLQSWTPGSGLPNAAEDTVYELWTNGTDLVVGTASSQGWGGTSGEISHLDNSGHWSSWSTGGGGGGGGNGMPSGYPIAMTMCGGIMNVAIWANNGGVARIDLQNSTVLASFTSQRLADGAAAAVACDNSDVLYIGYYEDDQPISRYNYQTGQWMNDITSSTHNIPSDPVWWGAMEYAGGKLAVGYEIGQQGSNVIGGGYVIIAANGASVGQASILSTGSPVTSLDWLGTQWLVGQAGGTSGYSHVDTLGQLGQNTIYSLPSLVSGQITTMAGNSTHLWAASSSYTNSGSGLLQGLRLANNSIEWQMGWTIPANAAVTDMELVGTDLYITTNNRGLRLLDTTTGTFQPTPMGLHNYQDGIKRVGDDLFIGLQGTSTSSAGIQVFDTISGTYSAGRLLAGLPSNNINGFLTTSANSVGLGYDMIYIATNNGVGRWNASGGNWETAWTTLDGLPTPNVEDIVQYWNDTIWLATPNGLSMYDETANSFTTYTRNDGLMGTSTWALVGKSMSSPGGGQPSLFIAHDGKGTDRPGVTQYNAMTQTVIAQHQFDQLPSNTVSAVATDYWGVHIATDVGPLIHWNSGTGDFESGANIFSMQEWPVHSMRSDGTHLIAIGDNGATVVQATANTHSVVAKFTALDSTGGCVVTGSYVWISTSNGLQGWHLNSGNEVTDSMRRANPLSVGLDLTFTDITNYTHPGMQFALVDAANAVTISADGSPGPHGVLMQNVPLTFSSPISGAATWAKLVDMKWNSTFDISSDSTLISSMQYAVDNGQLLNGTRHVTLRLQSPSNGSMWVKMVYDWIRTETPIQGVSLWDRPDDGGGALIANWSLVHDEDFSRYLVYLNEGPWATQPTVADLQPFTADAAVSLHSRLQTEITTIGGQPLQDGVDYWAVVVVEYNDGRFGTPSTPFGPAIASDEVPIPPLWASGAPHEGGQDGDLAVEWARCTALDLASTRIYATTSLITDALGLSVHTQVPPQEGNSTVIALEAGTPHWLALTCVDEAGQEDIMNATIIGPVVPTGGLNDGIPPSKLTGVWAEDVPQDDGGRVQMGWNNPTADDCAFITVYMRPIGDQDDLPSNVDGFSVAGIVPDCETNMTVLDSIGGFPLIDGQAYFIGAVASDKWLNSDTGDVTILEVTPFVNNIDGNTIPDRISSIDAWDHPDDDGTAIDVAWAPSGVDDFDYYVIWVSQHPVDDLADFWLVSGYEPGICGCIKMNKQWIDEDKSPIELQINTALYGGTDLFGSLPAQIMPNVELYVTVTVHDIKGNVHLNELTTATVTPIDNLADQTPPERLSELSLTDRPSDDGTAVLLDFGLSDASDIDHYEIYAASFSFDSVGDNGNGPDNPITILGRNPELPLLIEVLAYDASVIPNLPVTVAVVAVDSSGNAYRDNLVTATAISIDDGVDDVGAHLPNIEGIALEWIGDSILVTWDHSTNSEVRSYVIFISDKEFTYVDDSIMVGEVSAINSLLISPSLVSDLSNDSAWWIGVSAKGDNIYREKIDPVMIAPLGSEEGNGNGDGSNEETPTDPFLGSLFASENLLAIGLAIISLILLILVLRTRGNAKSRDKDWELQEATWGIQSRSGWDDVVPTPKGSPPVEQPPGLGQSQQSSIYAAAQRIGGQVQPTLPAADPTMPGRDVYQKQIPVLNPEPREPPKTEIDTSFLDDLL